MADLTIAIANILFFFGLLGVYLLRSALIGRRRHARSEADGGSVFLNKRTMEMVYWVLEPIIDRNIDAVDPRIHQEIRQQGGKHGQQQAPARADFARIVFDNTAEEGKHGAHDQRQHPAGHDRHAPD